MTLNPLWLIEEDTFDDEAINEICATLTKNDVAFKKIKYSPYIAGGELSKFIEKPDRILIPYGSIEFMQALIYELDFAYRQEYGMFSQAMFWCDFDSLDFSFYSSGWSELLLNDKFAIVPYSVLCKNLNYYFEKFGLEDNHGHISMFVRPCSNDKVFTGQVLYSDTAAHTLEYMGYSVPAEIPDRTLVSISTPKKILGEWRSLIIDGEVITVSSYSSTHNIHKEENADDNGEVIEFLKKVAEHDWQPDEAYIADVALVGKNYRLVEIGSPNCAGWYQMNIEKIVNAINTKVGNYIERYEEIMRI